MTIPLLAIDDTLERMSGDTELLNSLFQLYRADAPKKMADLELAMAENNFFQVERLAHSFKGASATVGAQQVLHLAATLEKAAKAEDKDGMTALYTQLEDACEQTLAAMRDFAASA